MLGQGKMLGVTLLALCALSPGVLSATIGFQPAVNYPVGKNPLAVASGDFDGDGKIDLAVVNNGDASFSDDGGVSILLGNGDGTFRPAANISAGKTPSSIAVADFNGDNRLDLAVINADGGLGNVGILLGNGDGTFQSPVDYVVASAPNAVAVGDFNGDHKPDVVVNASTLSLFLGNGDGTFQPRVDLGTGGLSVVVADFNADGRDDLAVPTASAGIAILLGNGDGTFQSAVSYDTPGLTIAIVPGDFNGDGKLDVFVSKKIKFKFQTNYFGDLLVGNGDGTFHLVSLVLNTGPDTVFQADFNGDRKLDLAAPGVLVWAGNGDGTFQTGLAFGGGDGRMAIIDLNGDKSPDVVVPNSGANIISVLLNTVGTDFSITMPPFSPSSLRPGQSVTSMVSLELLNAFDNPVSLACSVGPAQAGSPTCSLSSNSVTFDASGKASAQLTITAGIAAASLIRPSGHQDLLASRFIWLPVVGVLLAGTGIGQRSGSRKGLLGFLIGIFLFSGLIFQSACGGGSSGGPNAQTYTVTVTATSGSTQHSTTTGLKVQ